MESLLSLLLGSAISIAATWLFAWFYYRRAGEELRRESAELRRLSEILIRGLHGAGVLEARFENGRPVGLVFKTLLSETASLSDSVSAQVVRGGKVIE